MHWLIITVGSFVSIVVYLCSVFCFISLQRRTAPPCDAGSSGSITVGGGGATAVACNALLGELGPGIDLKRLCARPIRGGGRNSHSSRGCHTQAGEPHVDPSTLHRSGDSPLKGSRHSQRGIVITRGRASTDLTLLYTWHCMHKTPGLAGEAGFTRREKTERQMVPRLNRQDINILKSAK